MLIEIQGSGYNVPFYSDERIFLGEGLFETLRVLDNKPCYSQLHWQRLQRAALFLQLPFELSSSVWYEKLKQCIALNQVQDGGIKVILGAGNAPRGLVATSKKSRLVFTAFNYLTDNTAVKLGSSSWLRDSRNPVYQFKSINYLEAIIARRQAQLNGIDDVLFFNTEQCATDTTTANLFIIKNNQLFTPSLQNGLLPGITRQRLLSLCQENNIPCFECNLNKTSLSEAEAVFICNALQGIRPVSLIDNTVFKTNHSLIPQLQAILAADQRNSLR
ncbi:4-amino-4-deoxychorismate lyase [Legionella feeleii]|uniref:Aminodeoxychorismate lyase n=1 Tax=Legionella feeleii TaxID=453 RepID=A0A0W0TK47_9GAMM|nr:4-amino-4-deoxychorismate lyase [Legionella feeleii]SPX60289.1 4-amino-4-deoxychorismate lyase [Legionella feeleii]